MKTASVDTFRFPEVRVVEASAGSGKTYALAKRYVQLLLNPALELEQIPIRNILAITFTNKASFEMKARILDFLKKLALNEIPKSEADEILGPLGLNQNEASQKAFLIMESIIHNYNFFQVQTIDKFINALLSGCAFKIGLTANFKIKTNSFEYLEYSLDQLIDGAQDDKTAAGLLEKFLHNYLYLENRSGWFPKDDLLSILFALYQQNNTYGAPFQLGASAAEDLIKKKKVVLEDIKKLKETLPEGGTDKRFVTALDKFLVKNVNSFDIDSVSDYFAREIVPIKKGADVPKGCKDLWNKIRKNLKKVCEEEAFSLFNPYINVFSQVIETFYSISARDDVLFLEELNKKAGFLFDEDYITVEELYYRLATRYRHYLIDEFQDTSRLQWHNVEKMAEEALSTGGTLFYVGDRKQAIYSFRGGDVNLFDEVKNNFEPFNVQIENLTKNWRSQKAIVDFNNHIFSLDNLERFIYEKTQFEIDKKKKHRVEFSDAEIKDVENLFQGSLQTYREENNGGCVKFEYIDTDRKEERDEWTRDKLIYLIEDLKKRYAYKDIAILTRSNQEIEEVTHWLLEEGVFVESERTLNVKENFLVLELIAYLQFLDSPIDNLAFTDFILGDIFTSATEISSEEMHSFIFSLRQRLLSEKDFYIYTEFRKVYPKVWDEFFDPFFKNVGLYPLYELTVSILHKFDCLKQFPDQQGFLMHFLELIKKKEEDHNDIASFLKYFDLLQGEDSYVKISDSNAVKILTIHKAKGLEFPVVILPFLGMDVQVGASGENQQSYVIQQSDAAIDLLRLKNKYFNYSDKLYGIYAFEYQKALISELNSIYVALTRAQQELYGFIPKRVGNSFNFARLLIPEDSLSQGAPAKTKKKKADEKTIRKLSWPQYYDWIEFLKEEFHSYNQLRNRQKRHRGEVIHFMLSLVQNLNDYNIHEFIDRDETETKQKYTQLEEFKEYINVFEKIIHAPQLKHIFALDEGEIFTERDIVNKYGHSKRIDRLMITSKEVVIVDYKSSQEGKEEYQKQVQEYMELMKEIYPKKMVKGFLLYFDNLELEEVHV